MEKLRLLICLVVGILGLLAFVLGMVAEANRIGVKDIEITPSGTCLFRSTPAKVSAIVSALALLVAEVIVNAVVGCVCCGGTYRSSWKKAIAIICLVLSWVTFISAFGTLMLGAIRSDQHKTSRTFDYVICSDTSVRRGLFAGGAVLGLVSVSLGIGYYILASEVKKLTVGGPPQNQEIPMAQPSWKP